MRNGLALVLLVALLLAIWTGAAGRTDAGASVYSKNGTVQPPSYRHAVFVTLQRSKLNHLLALVQGI
jgi:hypothetical protein